MDLTLTPLGPLADIGVAVLPPDVLWDGQSGDFYLSKVPEDGGPGGFVAANPIASAVMMLLFSDARPSAALGGPQPTGDPRGWPGDGFDIRKDRGEGPLGSTFWRFRRAVVNDDTAREIELAALFALRPLKTQGLAERIEATAVALPDDGEVRLTVGVYAGEKEIYAQSFDALWRRADGGI